MGSRGGMNVITHFLVGWAIAENTALGARERAALTWVGVAPDLDGLGSLVHGVNRVFGHRETFYFAEWHHEVFHGLPGAIALAGVACAASRTQRLRAFLAALLVVHLHLLCDLVGSRGPTPDD